jgi:dolichol kinase
VCVCVCVCVCVLVCIMYVGVSAFLCRDVRVHVCICAFTVSRVLCVSLLLLSDSLPHLRLRCITEFKNCFELVIPEMDKAGRPLVTDPSEPLTEYIFSLSSPELKSKWLKALNRQIRRLSRETRQRDKRKLKVASAKADQVREVSSLVSAGRSSSLL